MATPIAHQGVVAGAKVLAMTMLDLMLRPELVAAARRYFDEVQCKDAGYVPFLDPADPPPIEMNRDVMARFRPAMRALYYDPARFATLSRPARCALSDAGAGVTPRKGQGLCPWTPAKAQPLQSLRLRNGVWGRRPRRVQGRAPGLTRRFDVPCPDSLSSRGAERRGDPGGRHAAKRRLAMTAELGPHRDGVARRISAGGLGALCWCHA